MYLSGFVFWQNVETINLYLRMRVYNMVIHVFGEVQVPTSTGDLHDEYLKNIFECSHKPQNY